jgi:hypothetical protein
VIVSTHQFTGQDRPQINVHPYPAPQPIDRRPEPIGRSGAPGCQCGGAVAAADSDAKSDECWTSAGRRDREGLPRLASALGSMHDGLVML